IVTSTYGDGEPPDNARGFWDSINVASPPSLAGARYSICSLGDQNYPNFCAFGRALDARLEQLGARRVHHRQDCDVDFESSFQKWLAGALGALAPHENENREIRPHAGESPATESELHTNNRGSFDRQRPYPASLKVNCRLTGKDSAK